MKKKWNSPTTPTDLIFFPFDFLFSWSLSSLFVPSSSEAASSSCRHFSCFPRVSAYGSFDCNRIQSKSIRLIEFDCVQKLEICSTAGSVIERKPRYNYKSIPSETMHKAPCHRPNVHILPNLSLMETISWSMSMYRGHGHRVHSRLHCWFSRLSQSYSLQKNIPSFLSTYSLHVSGLGVGPARTTVLCQCYSKIVILLKEILYKNMNITLKKYQYLQNHIHKEILQKSISQYNRNN